MAFGQRELIALLTCRTATSLNGLPLTAYDQLETGDARDIYSTNNVGAEQRLTSDT